MFRHFFEAIEGKAEELAPVAPLSPEGVPTVSVSANTVVEGNLTPTTADDPLLAIFTTALTAAKAEAEATQSSLDDTVKTIVAAQATQVTLQAKLKRDQAGVAALQAKVDELAPAPLGETTPAPVATT